MAGPPSQSQVPVSVLVIHHRLHNGARGVRVCIDGDEAADVAGTDPVVLNVTPGRHLVRVAQTWEGEIGVEEREVEAPGGWTIQLYYTGPRWLYGRGALEFQPVESQWTVHQSNRVLVWVGCIIITAMLASVLITALI